jgi:hypothetical protein
LVEPVAEFGGRPSVSTDKQSVRLGPAHCPKDVDGDFFASVPAGADAYIMTAILHDWDDDASAAILRNCCAAMRPSGRVLIGDFVLKPANEPDFGKSDRPRNAGDDAVGAGAHGRTNSGGCSRATICVCGAFCRWLPGTVC